MNDVKRYLQNILTTDHRHGEASEWVMCRECAPKVQLWESERQRLRRLYPEKFLRNEQEYKPSQQTANHADMLNERLKTDAEYRNELNRKFKGNMRTRII